MTEENELSGKFTLWLAKPRGFCAGVDRAISIVEESLKKFGPPIYVKHQIVHNPHVVSRLAAKGAIFVEEISEIPERSKVIFSAHGVSPTVRADAAERNLEPIDATCPLVTKVHKEALRFSGKDYGIVLIGHRNHVEVEGTHGHAPDKIKVVGTKEEAEALEFPEDKPLAYITQTTLSVDDTREIIKTLERKFPRIDKPPKQDICYATTNRQNAVKELARKTDFIFVVGAPNSSNTLRLVEVAKLSGANSLRIQSKDELDLSILSGRDSAGITAGASAPEDVVQEIARIILEETRGRAMELEITAENTFFPLPLILRRKPEPTAT